MKKIVGFLFFFAAMPYRAHANLLPAEHLTCVNATDSAFAASCSEEMDFYIDQNGRCGCFSKVDIISSDICTNDKIQCNETDGQTLSHLYQYRNDESGLVEITFAGCGCYSEDQGLQRTFAFKEDRTKSTSLPHQQNIEVACSVSDLVAAITAANIEISATLNLASNCSYIVETPETMTDALPVITGNITLIGGEKTVIARGLSSPLFRIFNVSNDGTLTLKNLSIQNGNIPGLGGGILNNGTLVLEQITFSNNTAGNGGGLATITGAHTTIINSQFISNTTTSVGGGGLISFGVTIVNNSRFYGNTAPINGGASNTQPGGTFTASFSDFFNNISDGLGGALSNLGLINIDHSRMQFNTGSSGGAIATGTIDVILSLDNIVNNVPDNCSPLNTIAGCID